MLSWHGSIMDWQSAVAGTIRRLAGRAARAPLSVRASVLAVVLFAVGCHSTPTPTEEDCAARYGLERTHEYDDVIERGVLLTDLVLGNDVKERAQFTGHHADWYPKVAFATAATSNSVHVTFVGSSEYPEIRFTNSVLVPVSVIAGGQLSDAENSFVPQGEHCILMNAKALGGLFDVFALGAGRDQREFSSFERALMVAIVLLHELGHVHYQDQDPASPNNKDVNGVVLSSTEKEIRADRFAVAQIRQAWNSSDETRVPGIGTSRSALANHMARVIVSAANFQALRTDPWGILNHRPNLGAFNREGYSHLNIFLRIHIMAYQMEGTPDRHDALRDVVGDAIDTKFAPPKM